MLGMTGHVGRSPGRGAPRAVVVAFLLAAVLGTAAMAVSADPSLELLDLVAALTRPPANAAPQGTGSSASFKLLFSGVDAGGGPAAQGSLTQRASIGPLGAKIASSSFGLVGGIGGGLVGAARTPTPTPSPTPTTTPSPTVTPTPTQGPSPTPTPDLAPPNVSNLVALGADASVTLTWTNPSSSALASVRVMRRTGGYPSGPTDSTATPVVDAKTESHADSGLANGTLYYYGVYAHDGAGHYASGAFVQATPASAPPDQTPPKITTGPFVDVSDNLATVIWTTDEPSQGKVEYGLTPAFGQTASGSGLRTDHAITLTGLTPATGYTYRACAKDGFANEACSAPATFTTKEAPDAVAPKIVEGPVVVKTTHESARIEFRTDKLARYDIFYGTTRSYGETASGTRFETLHSAEIGKLQPATLYHYAVKVTNQSGFPEVTTGFTFQTGSQPDRDPPLIIGRPLLEGVTDRIALLTWGTDEPADSLVRFGTASAVLGESFRGTPLVHDHRIYLTGLVAGTRYYYKVSSTDGSGNGPTDSGVFDFSTLAGPDGEPPRIVQGPVVDTLTVSESTAIISFWVNEPVVARLHLTPAPPRNPFATECCQRRQRVVLTGLQPSTEYRVRIELVDFAYNVGGPAKEAVFRTPASPDSLLPRFLCRPNVLAKRSGLVLLAWCTDEPTEGQVVVKSSSLSGSSRAGTDTIWSRPGAERDHQAVLTRLTPGASYQLQANARAGDGSWVGSGAGDVTIDVPTEPDTAAPVITEPTVMYVSSDVGLLRWTTNEPSMSEVVYTIAGGGERSISDPVFATDHVIMLSNLTPGGRVEWSIRATDPTGNTSAKTNGLGFTTPGSPDTRQPVVQSVTIEPLGSTEVVVRWETDEAADSVVEFGASTSYGSSIMRGEDAIKHEVTLTRLDPGTAYHLRAGSTDPADNGVAWSGDVGFATSAVPLSPPVVGGALALLGAALVFRRRRR